MISPVCRRSCRLDKSLVGYLFACWEGRALWSTTSGDFLFIQSGNTQQIRGGNIPSGDGVLQVNTVLSAFFSPASLLGSRTMPGIVLVTGGTGLVGKAIQYVIDNEPEGSRFGKQLGEKWIFASSRDADLRYLSNLSRGHSDSCVYSYEQGPPTNLAAL